MLAAALIPVIGAVATAVDYARVTEVRERLADALEAGIAEVASEPALPNADVLAALTLWLNQHMGARYAGCCRLDSVSDDGKGTITAVASGSVATSVARLVGLDSVPISVKRSAHRALGNLPK